MATETPSRLDVVRETLAAQNEQLANVSDALGALPPGANLDVPQEWMDAFEEATEVQVQRAKPAPIGAVRV
jgi:hypothetical protein